MLQTQDNLKPANFIKLKHWLATCDGKLGATDSRLQEPVPVMLMLPDKGASKPCIGLYDRLSGQQLVSEKIGVHATVLRLQEPVLNFASYMSFNILQDFMIDCLGNRW